LKVTRDACTRPGEQVIGERDVVQVLQGILRRAQAGAGVGAGECFVLREIGTEKSGDFESINCLYETSSICDKIGDS